MIGVFDSGIGGVTVLKEIIKLLPNYHYLYYSDSFNNPYGDKKEEELLIITKNIVQLLIDKGCKIIVIACNTASAICKDYLRGNFDVSIIAIEPAIKQVFDNSPKGKTLVMATKGTIESEKFLKLYNSFSNDEMIIEAFPGLADLIEQDRKEDLKIYLQKKLHYNNIKNVVLGCTHYPLIKNEIKEILGDVNFFEGSFGVAKKVKDVANGLNLKESTFKLDFIDSSNSKSKEQRFFDIVE
ncbi:glutamate racemase [uncultured Clostridium sp.]|uniref:glutamate racemase n=1 Tax=uncultured Clostridium sp. TaxID=59620 RepID=UPI00272E5A61|nr:glutamate racemase [uncultured Clostridium sp.]